MVLPIRRQNQSAMLGVKEVKGAKFQTDPQSFRSLSQSATSWRKSGNYSPFVFVFLSRTPEPPPSSMNSTPYLFVILASQLLDRD
jgi:hypothetical protein